MANNKNKVDNGIKTSFGRSGIYNVNCGFIVTSYVVKIGNLFYLKFIF